MTDIAEILKLSTELYTNALRSGGALIMTVAKFNELRIEGGAEPLDWPDPTALVRVTDDEVRLLGDDSE